MHDSDIMHDTDYDKPRLGNQRLTNIVRDGTVLQCNIAHRADINAWAPVFQNLTAAECSSCRVHNNRSLLCIVLQDAPANIQVLGCHAEHKVFDFPQPCSYTRELSSIPSAPPAAAAKCEGEGTHAAILAILNDPGQPQ